MFLVRKTEFRGGTKHPAGIDPAQFARLDLNASGQDSSRQRARHLVAHLVILGSADNLTERASIADIHFTDLETIRLGMLFRSNNLGNNDEG